MFCEFVVQGDTKIYARRYGDEKDEAILMIHGACVDSDFFHGAAEILSHRYTVYTYDRRGTGRSEDAADARYDPEIQIQDAENLLKRIGCPCHIIAHSMGCNYGMGLAVKSPHLVKSLLLHEPSCMSCLPSGDSCLKELQEIRQIRANGAKSMALYRCMNLEMLDDERSRSGTEEEVLHRDRNCDAFINHEFAYAHMYVPEYEKLRQTPVFVGLGEKSDNHYHARNCPIIAKQTGGELLYFPGGHNGPTDLPREFSYLAAGCIEEVLSI